MFGPARLPWIGLALGLVAVLYGMMGFWVRGYDNYDRAIIFLATAWLLQQYHARFQTLTDTPRPKLGLLLVIVGALSFLPPWFVFTQIGPRPIILWWEALALVAATVGVILIRSGPNLLHQARFLLIFPLFALPLPGRVQNPLHEIMQAISADLGAELIPLFGVGVKQKDANRIILASGEGIHVAEVCSGLYMIRTTLSITAFLAHLFRFSPLRSLVLMGCSIPIIIFVNALRVTAFGCLQEWGYRQWVEPGFEHELIGYVAYIPGLLLVLLIVKWLKPAATEVAEDAGSPPVPSGRISMVAAVVLFCAALAAIGILAVPGVSTSAIAEPDFGRFPTRLGDWQRGVPLFDPATREFKIIDEDFPFNEEVRTKLTYNSAVNRRYATKAKDAAGHPIEYADVWVIYWKSAMTVKDYHHPDVCYVGSGDKLETASVEMRTTPGGRQVPMTYREFTGSDGRRKFVVYWTQEGRRIWTAKDESQAASFLFPFYWMQDRLKGTRVAGQTDDRLVIHIGMPSYPAANKITLLKFAEKVADEVYTLCPWADPKGP